ncbi:magnesium citrate secondary transporter [Shivajiella indica]|uniref:Magnesium citrate secondary transporter n=1 Tax=Shivajiella indica TaxID=872115 RepID=A0ABW5BC97_9BACT
MMRVFKNPYFVLACLIFWVNQVLEKYFGIFIPWIHEYLDDLLAMPVVLGITLQIFRWIHPQKGKFRFSKIQVAVGWLYFSFLFEFLLPKWSKIYTSDIWDVLAYGIGSLAFFVLINVNSTSNNAPKL